jgi:hypothetical protein
MKAYKKKTWLYKTVINGEEYTFACGEFSNLVYGFYVYRF